MPNKPNYKQIFAIKKKNEEKIKKLCPKAIETAGCYIFHRYQGDFRFAYIGLATKSLLSRLGDHLNGYESHIDLSIRKWGLYDEVKNPQGYHIDILCYCKPEECNEKEQYYIKKYANLSYQLLNKTSGSQDGDKFGITENKPTKNYHQGVAYGELKTKRKVKEYFDKYLDFTIKSPSNKIKERKYNEFKEWLEDGE
jgi:hypothetical protein